MADSLEREDQLRRALVADVAHELRTPIAVLQAETEALVDRVTEPSPAALSSVHDEAVRLGRMVEDLQTLASAEAAGLHLERRLLDVGRVAGEAADSLSPRFQAAGVHLDQTLPPTVVVGDPHRLYQVVANLLSNAAKFTPSGGQVNLRVTTDGPDALIEVADTGPGIPEGELPQVWDRFFRGKAGQSVAGSGIGLAVVKELVDAHGGTVAVESPPAGARILWSGYRRPPYRTEWTRPGAASGRPVRRWRASARPANRSGPASLRRAVRPRARPRARPDIPGVERLPANGAHHHGRGHLPAALVGDLHRWSIGRRVLVAPLAHGSQHGPQVTSLVSEPVVVAGRMFAVRNLGQDACLHQMAEAMVQDVAGDSQAGLEIVEAGDPQEHIAQDEHRPPFAHHLQALGHRAPHFDKALPFHRNHCSRLHHRMPRRHRRGTAG